MSTPLLLPAPLTQYRTTLFLTYVSYLCFLPMSLTYVLVSLCFLGPSLCLLPVLRRSYLCPMPYHHSELTTSLSAAGRTTNKVRTQYLVTTFSLWEVAGLLANQLKAEKEVTCWLLVVKVNLLSDSML